MFQQPDVESRMRRRFLIWMLFLLDWAKSVWLSLVNILTKLSEIIPKSHVEVKVDLVVLDGKHVARCFTRHLRPPQTGHASPLML